MFPDSSIFNFDFVIVKPCTCHSFYCCFSQILGFKHLSVEEFYYLFIFLQGGGEGWDGVEPWRVIGGGVSKYVEIEANFSYSYLSCFPLNHLIHFLFLCIEFNSVVVSGARTS